MSSTFQTTVPFFDHLLTAFAKHSLTDLTVRASGDTHIDAHHTVEDVSIVLGQAIREALGDKSGIARYGDADLPMQPNLPAFVDRAAIRRQNHIPIEHQPPCALLTDDHRFAGCEAHDIAIALHNGLWNAM